MRRDRHRPNSAPTRTLADDLASAHPDALTPLVSTSVTAALRGDAPTADTIYARSGGTPLEFARALAQLPATELVPQANPPVALRRVTKEGTPYRIEVSPAHHDDEPEGNGESLIDGFDVLLTIRTEGLPSAAVETESHRLLADIRTIGVPALVTSDRFTALARWTPESGLHRFEQPVSVHAEDRAAWQAVALPVIGAQQAGPQPGRWPGDRVDRA